MSIPQTLVDLFPEVIHAPGPLARQLQENMLYTNPELFDVEFAQLQALKEKLSQEHVHLGQLLGVGRQALVCSIVDDAGKTLEHSVVRLEPLKSVGDIDSPAVTPILGKVEGESVKNLTMDSGYQATIALKAGPMAGEPTLNKMLEIFKILNAEKKDGVSKLFNCRDVQLDQIMQLSGITYRNGQPAPILVDLNSIATSYKDKQGYPGVAEFAKQRDLSFDDIKAAAVERAEIVHLRKQQNALAKKARAELKAAHIEISDEQKKGR